MDPFQACNGSLVGIQSHNLLTLKPASTFGFLGGCRGWPSCQAWYSFTFLHWEALCDLIYSLSPQAISQCWLSVTEYALKPYYHVWSSEAGGGIKWIDYRVHGFSRIVRSVAWTAQSLIISSNTWVSVSREWLILFGLVCRSQELALVLQSVPG